MALYNSKGQLVNLPKGKELSDHAKRQLTEKLEPQDHKGHAFFRVEERAHLK